MFYKIVGVSDNCPDQPVVYHGEFEHVDGEPPVLEALAKNFGTQQQVRPAERLVSWSGGESIYWLEDLADDYDATEWQFFNDDTNFYVKVDDEPLA